jgi:hypothetical protein
MRNQPWLAASFFTGLLVGTACLLVVPEPPALGAEDTAQSTKKPGQAPGKDAKKPDDEVKPGPYAEDPLLPAVERGYKGSGAYRWLNVALQATAREHERHGARPTIGSRNLGIVVTAMYDAWAAYDDKAVGTRLGDELRRPAAERSTANKDKAIGHAICRVLLDMYAEDADWIKERVRKEGIDPDDTSTLPSTPQGIGNLAANALLAYRHYDGSNQLGDEVGSNGKPYSDWTYYKPVNPPDKILDPDRWQPIPFDDGKGGKITIGFLTPHW